MNAPTNFATSDIWETDAIRAYRHAISIHCPDCDDMMMAARCDLAAIRDRSSIAIGRASESAGVVLGEVCRLATSAVYADVPTSELIRIRATLDFLFEGARAVERITRQR